MADADSSPQNANETSQNMDGLITNAFESISRLRDMRPAINNAQQVQALPTMASEVVRLFPTIQHAASNMNRNHGRNLTARQGGSGNKRCQAKLPPSNKKMPKKKKLLHKDIVFIFNPAVDKVPTHQTRLRLEKKGRIIHDFAFDRDWMEWRLHSAIEEEMPMLANGEYEFLKVTICTFSPFVHHSDELLKFIPIIKVHETQFSPIFILVYSFLICQFVPELSHFLSANYDTDTSKNFTIVLGT